MLNAKSTAHRGKRRLSSDERAFRQWVSLFGGELFVNLAIYADESGTHDKAGVQPQSQVSVVAGFVAKANSWLVFQRYWADILEKYKAPYFHYTELQFALRIAGNTVASERQKRKNPYLRLGWSKQKCEDFLLECAKIAMSGSKIPVGGDFETRGYAERLKSIPKQLQENNPPALALHPFYVTTLETILCHWPELDGPITFCFERNLDWQHAIIDVHNKYKKQWPRIVGPVFGDKEESLFYGLQAADLLAGTVRQLARYKLNYDPIPVGSLSEVNRIFCEKFRIKDMRELLSHRSPV
jgi:hypothetical protein